MLRVSPLIRPRLPLSVAVIVAVPVQLLLQCCAVYGSSLDSDSHEIASSAVTVPATSIPAPLSWYVQSPTRLPPSSHERSKPNVALPPFCPAIQPPPVNAQPASTSTTSPTSALASTPLRMRITDDLPRC